MSEGNGMLRTSQLPTGADTPIRKWIVCGTGFTQSMGKANGFDRLWDSLRELTTRETVILPPYPWNHNWDDLADFISRFSDSSGVIPDIRTINYSWGCGYGFPAFAKALGKRGLRIRGACLCDPVYYRWGRWLRAVIWSPEIVVPANVEQVIWLRQTQNRPKGTNLLREDAEQTTIHDPVIVSRNHEWMDDSLVFHQMALRLAKSKPGSDGRLVL